MQHSPKTNKDQLYPFYKRARNQLRRLEPTSTISHAIQILHKVARGGIEVMRYYQPWNVLLLVRWAIQAIDPVAHRRPPARLDDIHKVLNIIHEMEGHVRMPDEYEHIFLFMRHLAFQQFWLQHEADGASIARQELLFCKLANDHPFQRDFLHLTGLHCSEFTELAFGLMAMFLSDQKRFLVKRSHFENLEERFALQTLDSFLSTLSLDLPSAHALLTSDEEKERSVSDQVILPTLMRYYPLLRHDDDYIAYSPTLLFRSLEGFIYRRLKRDNKNEFSTRFGPIFERYVADCMSEAGVTYFEEFQLNKMLPGTGKCVDFLIVENDCNILIDAKGVEVSNLGMLSHRAEIVFRSLKESAGKAIKQGMETARRIAARQPSSSISLAKGGYYLFVVTFDDLHLGSNTEFESMFGVRIVDSFRNELGERLPIPFTNIFFLAVDEFECLLAAVQEGTTTFIAAINRAQQNDSDRRTRKFSFIQHLAELSPRPKRLPTLQRALDDLCSRAASRFRK